MDDLPTIASVLTGPEGRAAVAAGDAGAVLRLARRARGWSQQELERRSGYSQSTISRLERNKSRAARDTTVLVDLAAALGLPPGALGLAARGGETARTLDDVDRRDFLGSALGFAVTALLPQAVATPSRDCRIDAAGVTHCWTAIRRLFELDDQGGGSTVYQLAEGMAERLEQALRSGTYSSKVGRELQHVTAAAMDAAGWLAYDAGGRDKARHWWLETCHLADLSGIPAARVTALASMALQASTDPSRGKETVALAQAARSAAGSHATPSLLSLLAAREALGHAHCHDRAAARSSMFNAWRLLDQEKRDDEPLWWDAWLDFWGAADLACHETRVSLALGDKKKAEQAARSASSAIDSTTYPRNFTIYTGRLGATLTYVGQLDEAISVTGQAIQRVGAVRGSRRIVSDLHRTVALLEQQRYAPAKDFAAAAKRLLPAA